MTHRRIPLPGAFSNGLLAPRSLVFLGLLASVAAATAARAESGSAAASLTLSRGSPNVEICVNCDDGFTAGSSGLLLSAPADVLRAPAVFVSKAGDGLGAPVILPLNSSLKSAKGSPSGRFLGFDGGLPVSAMRISSAYGMRRHPIYGGYRMHSGIDLVAPAGSPVQSPSDGIVTRAAWSGGYGLLVVVEHAGGVQTRFGHLSQVAVTSGQKVRKGQLLGLVGSTGTSTGAHLHYEMRLNGSSINPMRINHK